MTVEVNSLEQYNEELATSGQKLVVVNFCAQWAGPCRVLATQLKGLAMNHDLILLKVDMDHAGDVVIDEEISAVPTLKFYKVGVKILLQSCHNRSLLRITHSSLNELYTIS